MKKSIIIDQMMVVVVLVSGEAGKRSAWCSRWAASAQSRESLDVTTRGVVSTSNYSVVYRQPRKSGSTEMKKEGIVSAFYSNQRTPVAKFPSFLFAAFHFVGVFYLFLCFLCLFCLFVCTSLFLTLASHSHVHACVCVRKEGERGGKQKDGGAKPCVPVARVCERVWVWKKTCKMKKE
jgi:hypothetical protein